MSRRARVAAEADDVMEVAAYEMETYQLTKEDSTLDAVFRTNAQRAARRPPCESTDRALRRARCLANHVARYEVRSPVSSPRSSRASSGSYSVGSVVGSGDETTFDDPSHDGDNVSGRVGKSRGNTKESRDGDVNVRGDANVRGRGQRLRQENAGNYSCDSVVSSGDETTFDDLSPTCGKALGRTGSSRASTKDVSQSRDVDTNVLDDAMVRGCGQRLRQDDSGSYSFDSVACSGDETTFDDLSPNCGKALGRTGNSRGSNEDVSQSRDVAANVRDDADVRGGGRRLSSFLWLRYRRARTRVVPENSSSDKQSHGDYQERVPRSSLARKKISSVMRRAQHAKNGTEMQRSSFFLVSPTGAVDGHFNSFDQAMSDDLGSDSDLPGEGDVFVRRDQPYLTSFLKKRVAGVKSVIDKGRMSVYSWS